MNYTEIATKANRGILVTRKKENIFLARVSVNFQDVVKNVHTDAVSMIYTEALLAGCSLYSRQAFLDKVNMLGAHIEMSITNGIFTCVLQSQSIHREKLLALVSEMLQKPTFALKEIQRIVELLSNQLREEKEDAKAQCVYKFVDQLYAENDHRYVYTEDALIAALLKISKKDLLSFHKNLFGRFWIYTIVSDENSAVKTVASLSNIQKKFVFIQNLQHTVKPLVIENTKVQITPIPSRQNVELAIGSSLPLNLTNKEYFAFLFGVQVLGKWGGFAGRLMSIIREKEGLTYGIYAKTEYTTARETGNWRIMTFFAPNKVLTGISSTLREIKKIAELGITEIEFTRFKTIIQTKEILLQDSIIASAQNMHHLQLAGLTLTEIKQYKKNLLLVTKKEINQALKKYLDVSKLVISAAGPIKGTEMELKALASLAKADK